MRFVRAKHLYSTDVLMRDIHTFLLFWEGFSVVTIKPDGDALQIDLIPPVAQFLTCGGCQKFCSATHDTVIEYGRELIDRFCVEDANRLRHAKPARKVVKRITYDHRDSEFFP